MAKQMENMNDFKPVIVDPISGLLVRYTDNGLKPGDLPGISQDPRALELDENGLPIGWEAPNHEQS